MDSEKFRIWYKEAQSLTYELTATYFPPDTIHRSVRKTLLAIERILNSTEMHPEEHRFFLRSCVYRLSVFLKEYRNDESDIPNIDSFALAQLDQLVTHLRIGLRVFSKLPPPQTSIKINSRDRTEEYQPSVKTSSGSFEPENIFASAAVMIAALSQAEPTWRAKTNRGANSLTVTSPNWERLGRMIRYVLKGLASPCMLFTQPPIYRKYDGEAQLEAAWVNVETLISSAFDEMAGQGQKI